MDCLEGTVTCDNTNYTGVKKFAQMVTCLHPSFLAVLVSMLVWLLYCLVRLMSLPDEDHNKA